MRKIATLTLCSCMVPNPAFDPDLATGAETETGGEWPATSGESEVGSAASSSTSSAVTCGDGRVAAGEQCDDGNMILGDGCDECHIVKYEAEGPQINVDAALLVGWKECYVDSYNSSGFELAALLDACNKAHLMLACREKGSGVFALLAHAPRAEVVTDTAKSDTPHVANGSGWYFHNDWSWGFAKADDPIHRIKCDIEAVNPEQRLCWHTTTGSLTPGWRCGGMTGLESISVERVVLHAD